jgi:glutamate/tyrosine decarboxylase-like PLP-dependent enzyme
MPRDGASGVRLRADSWAIDGHKWLQTPYDCGYAIVRDADAHRRAMTIAASYLPMAAAGDRDPTHFVPELSRRARGFATWVMIRHLGRAGIAALVQEHCRLAARFAEGLVREPGVYVLNDVVLNQVIVRFGKPEADETADRLTRETILRVQSRRHLLRGRCTLARSLGDAAIGYLCPDHRGGHRPELRGDLQGLAVGSSRQSRSGR